MDELDHTGGRRPPVRVWLLWYLSVRDECDYLMGSTMNQFTAEQWEREHEWAFSTEVNVVKITDPLPSIKGK